MNILFWWCLWCDVEWWWCGVIGVVLNILVSGSDVHADKRIASDVVSRSQTGELQDPSLRNITMSCPAAQYSRFLSMLHADGYMKDCLQIQNWMTTLQRRACLPIPRPAAEQSLERKVETHKYTAGAMHFLGWMWQY